MALKYAKNNVLAAPVGELKTLPIVGWAGGHTPYPRRLHPRALFRGSVPGSFSEILVPEDIYELTASRLSDYVSCNLIVVDSFMT